jgi:hypothetical protein
MEYLVGYIWPNRANRNELAKDFFEKAKSNIEALQLDSNCAFCLCFKSNPWDEGDMSIVVLVENHIPEHDRSIVHKRLKSYFDACNCPEYDEMANIYLGPGTTVDNLAERMEHTGRTVIEVPLIKKADTPINRKSG